MRTAGFAHPRLPRLSLPMPAARQIPWFAMLRNVKINVGPPKEVSIITERMVFCQKYRKLNSTVLCMGETNTNPYILTILFVEMLY